MNVFLPIRDVECYGVHHVPVPDQGVQLFSRGGVPDPAGSVIASCDKANTGREITHNLTTAVC